MANTSAKTLVRSNRARLALLRQAILITNAVYAVVRVGVYWSSFDSRAATLWSLFAVLSAGPYTLLAFAARPTYQGGVIVDGGEDISRRGMYEYAHDTIYLTALAQVGTIFTRYAVLLLCVIPLYAMGALLLRCCRGGASGPDIAPVADDPFEGMSRKERRKAQRTKQS